MSFKTRMEDPVRHADYRFRIRVRAWRWRLFICITLHCIAVQRNAVQCNTLQCTALHYLTVGQMSLQHCKLETKASSHEGQCIPAGSSVSPPTLVLLFMSIITMRICRKTCVRLFTLCKISTAILRILWRHLQTDLRNV